MKEGLQSLKTGYSTGACAVAAALGAWAACRGTVPDSVEVLFPDGVLRVLPVYPDNPPGTVCIRKDGGDDPDCTHGAIVHARFLPCGSEGERMEPLDSRDYLLSFPDEGAEGKGPSGNTEAACLSVDPAGGKTVQTEAGLLEVGAEEGIGLCTRPGLDCEPGKWAINVVPRTMLQQNLQRAGFFGHWRLVLGIRDGERLASHTLNSRLGVVGGLSILGTSGLVRPYSHEAYIETIRICLRSYRLDKGTHVVLYTGGRTRKGAMLRYPELPETAFVGIGDYIAESLQACGSFSAITVACMGGKLCKYAAGYSYTHAHTVEQAMHLALDTVESLPDMPPGSRFAHCASVRELLLCLSEPQRLLLLKALAKQAFQQLRHFMQARQRLELMVFDFDGHWLFDYPEQL